VGTNGPHVVFSTVGWIICAGQDGYGFNYTILSTKWAMNSDVSNFFELKSANQSLYLDL
jgi:hypothetical protein